MFEIHLWDGHPCLTTAEASNCTKSCLIDRSTCPMAGMGPPLHRARKVPLTYSLVGFTLFTCVSSGGDFYRSTSARCDSHYSASRSVVFHPEPPTLSVVFRLAAYCCFLAYSCFYSGPPQSFLTFLQECHSRNRLLILGITGLPGCVWHAYHL